VKHTFLPTHPGARGYFGASVPYESVVEYFENVNWQKSSIVNHYSFGKQKQLENIIRFAPYQSTSDTLKQHQGVSRHTDAFDYWSESGENVWKNIDIYPVNDNYEQPLDQRTTELLNGEKIIFTWKTDIYGNDYALIKSNVTPIKQLPVNTNTTPYDTEYYQVPLTASDPVGENTNLVTDNYHKNKNLTDQLNLTGELYVRNNTYTGVQQLTSTTVSGIYSKYSVPGTITYRDQQVTLSDISTEITNNLLNFDLIHDTIIFETQSYIVFEKIEYNYSTGEIKSGHNNFAFVKKNYHNNKYEKCSNWWYDKSTNNILMLKTTIHPELSGTTNKMIYPESYVYNMITGILKRTYPDPDLTNDQIIYETGQYSLSGINKLILLISTV